MGLTWWRPMESATDEHPSEMASVRRASLTLKVLAGIYIVGIVFAGLPGSAPQSLLETVTYNIFAGGLAGMFLLAAFALDRAKPWAVGIFRPLLALLFVWGAYTFIALLIGGVFRIPTTMIAAGLALFWPADVWPTTRLSGRGVIVLAVVAALCLLQSAARPLFGWGGLYDVHANDHHGTLTVDCGSDGPPERITIAYDWSWTGDALLPNDEDQVVMGWNGDGTDGRPLYVAIELPRQSDGYYLGVSSGASGPMASQVAATWRGVFMIRLDLHELEIRPGRVEAVLVRTAAAAAEDQSVTFGASYIHAGVWRKDAETVTCSW